MNANYCCTCCICKDQFFGDKREVQCSKCKNLGLLKASLEKWIEEWDNKKIKTKEDAQNESVRKDLIVKYTSMAFLAQWIINSINGELINVHGANICNNILKED